MLCQILKNFRYADEAGAECDAKVDQVLNIPDEYVPGLAFEGFIDPQGEYTKTLIGSNLFPDSMEILGEVHSLGDVVAATFEASGMDYDTWNGLDEKTRDAMIEEHLRGIVAEAEQRETAAVTGQTPGPAPAQPPAAPAAAMPPAVPPAPAMPPVPETPEEND